MSTPDLTPDSFETFGEMLKYLRRRERMTQRTLSIAVGYSEAQIGRLENNQRRPDLTTLKALFVPALHIENEPAVVEKLVELAQSARRQGISAIGVIPDKDSRFFDGPGSKRIPGREALVTQISDRMNRLLSNSSSRFLAVVGVSGSGKSLLLQAGVAVALRQAGHNVSILTPGAHPLRSLDIHLAENNIEAGSHSALVLVDQFEEVFVLCKDEMERTNFINKLFDLAFESSLRVGVLIALRADFYSHCAQYPVLRQAVAASQEYIGRMTPEEMHRSD